MSSKEGPVPGSEEPLWHTWRGGSREIVFPHLSIDTNLVKVVHLPRLVETVTNLPHKSAFYALPGWEGGEQLGYITETPSIVTEVATDIMQRSTYGVDKNNGPLQWIRFNMARLKLIDAEYAAVSAAGEMHTDGEHFFDPNSVQYKRNAINEDYLTTGPDNISALINVFGQGDLTIKTNWQYNHDFSKMNIPYEPGTGVLLSSNIRHKVSPPLDALRTVDPNAVRGFVFFGFDHRLVPAA